MGTIYIFAENGLILKQDKWVVKRKHVFLSLLPWQAGAMFFSFCVFRNNFNGAHAVAWFETRTIPVGLKKSFFLHYAKYPRN